MSGELGFDGSHYQGGVNFSKLPSSITFCYYKCVEGTAPDPTYVQARHDALNVGRQLFMPYYWSHPNIPAAQCISAFRYHAGFDPRMGRPIIDIESADGQTPDQIHSWLHEWYDDFKDIIDIYTGYYFWTDSVAPAAHDCQRCADRNLYLARYPNVPNLKDYNYGDVPLPFIKPTVWQYSDHGTLSGVPNPVDLDVIVTGNISTISGWDNPTPEGEDMANVKYFLQYVRTSDGKIYEVNLMAGTYWHIPNTADLTARHKELDAASIPYRAGIAATSDITQWGKEIK